MKDKFKEQGITLIALVITIVVLIILAGVIISITIGNGGIIDRAKTAKQEYANAQGYEKSEIGEYGNQIDEYAAFTRAGGSNISPADLQLDYANSVDISSKIGENNNYTIPQNGVVLLMFSAGGSGAHVCNTYISGYPIFPIALVDNQYGVTENTTLFVNKDQTIYFTFTVSTNNNLKAYFVPYKK